MCVNVRLYGIMQARHKSIDLVFQNNIPDSLSDVLYFDIDTKKMSQVLVLPPPLVLLFTPPFSDLSSFRWCAASFPMLSNSHPSAETSQ